MAYLLRIRKIWTVKLFTNREQIRLLNSKSTDLDWYYSRHYWKLKSLVRDLLFITFVNHHPPPCKIGLCHQRQATELVEFTLGQRWCGQDPGRWKHSESVHEGQQHWTLADLPRRMWTAEIPIILNICQQICGRVMFLVMSVCHSNQRITGSLVMVTCCSFLEIM